MCSCHYYIIIILYFFFSADDIVNVSVCSNMNKQKHICDPTPVNEADDGRGKILDNYFGLDVHIKENFNTKSKL